MTMMISDKYSLDYILALDCDITTHHFIILLMLQLAFARSASNNLAIVKILQYGAHRYDNEGSTNTALNATSIMRISTRAYLAPPLSTSLQ